MRPVSQPLQVLLAAVAVWIHQQQREVIDDLQAENRVLREYGRSDASIREYVIGRVRYSMLNP